VPPRTTPSTGGNVPPPAYSSWDKHGCYKPGEIVGSCNGISDAAGPFLQGGKCCFDVCKGTPAPCGRSFVVEGRARVADVVARGDWSAAPLGLDARPGGADALTAKAARAWRDDAALEHASIASFARLALELLALGAPPRLIEGAHRAALDEVEHARVCFAIATELSGATIPLGPAPLSLDGLAMGRDLAALAVSAAIEGCVGETVAALALARAAASCASSKLAAELAKMADDELTHASLAWECVAWACGRVTDPAARERVAQALAVPDFEPSAAVDEEHSAAWRSLGRLTPADLREVVVAARALIGDAKTQLFAPSAASAATSGGP
jgi:hypothetical protein